MAESYKIYTLHDPDTLAVRYVGFTSKTLEERLAVHIDAAKFRLSETSHRINWIRSILRELKSPSIMLVELVSSENWQERERFWIKHFRETMGCDLTNSCDGGEGIINASPETRAKLSAANRGKIPSQQARDKLRAANLGKTTPKEVRLKISTALRGRFTNKESIQKALAARRKPVVEISTGRIFSSLKEAASVLGVASSMVSYWLKAGKFAYANNQLKEVIAS